MSNNYDAKLSVLFVMQSINRYHVVEDSGLSNDELIKMSQETIHSYQTLANIFPIKEQSK